MQTLLVLLIFLLYYSLFYVRYEPRARKPPGPEYLFSSTAQPNQFMLYEDTGRVYLNVNGYVDVDFVLPDPYILRNNVVGRKDACDGRPDGYKTVARSRELYEYVKKRNLVGSRSETILENIHRILRKGQIFYFECRGEHVQSLNVCDGGKVLVQNSCVPIDDCLDKEVASTFADRLGREHFFQCVPRSRRKKCPPGTYFVVDSCRRLKAVDALCRNKPAFYALDATSYIRCDENGRAMKYRCPHDHVLFGETCEWNWCVGKAEGTKIKLPTETHDRLTYSPGYALCGKDGRIQQQIRCGDWHPFHPKAPVEDLTLLPMVFDGKECVPPSLCENVEFSDDHHHLIPTREYSMTLGNNWDRAHLFDASVGFSCDAGRKRRIPLDGGRHIKKMKIESMCDEDPRAKVVIGDDPTHYFDCSTNNRQTCPREYFFNGKTCQKRIQRAHTFRGLDVFRFDNLSSEDDWIQHWNYSNAKSPFKNPPDKLECVDPESKYLHGYNVCAHPHCASFGFLTQLDTFIFLPDGHVCYPYEGKIVKTPSQVLESGYQFWNQRGTVLLKPAGPSVPASENPCTFGQTIRSGNYVIDSVVYTTCDSAQPFVFCPAASTAGIIEIDGRHGEKVYACKPLNPGEGKMEAGETRQFQLNELERIEAIVRDTIVLVDQDIHTLQQDELLDIGGKDVKITTDKYLKLHYRYTVTYPPNAVFQGSIPMAAAFNETFIAKRSDWSNKPMILPSHTIEEHIDGFKMLKTKGG